MPDAVWIGRRAFRTIKQNLWFSTADNIISVQLAGLGWLPPIAAAAGQSLPDVVAMSNPLGSSAIRGRPAVGDRPTGWTLDPDPLAEVQTPGQVPRASDARVKRNSLARRSTVDGRQRLDERVRLQRVVPRSHAVTGMRRSSGETVGLDVYPRNTMALRI